MEDNLRPAHAGRKYALWERLKEYMCYLGDSGEWDVSCEGINVIVYVSGPVAG